MQLDFRSPAGRAEAAALLDTADVVIEASRPRALEQLGLGPEDRPERPGRVWLSITGHGRSAPGRDWVAFGDDAAVAGGLVGWDASSQPVFCGDAIADPITGLVGAVAVLRALAAGGGQLIDLAMSRRRRGGRGRGRGGRPVDAAGRGGTRPRRALAGADGRRWSKRCGIGRRRWSGSRGLRSAQTRPGRARSSFLLVVNDAAADDRRPHRDRAVTGQGLGQGDSQHHQVGGIAGAQAAPDRRRRGRYPTTTAGRPRS